MSVKSVSAMSDALKYLNGEQVVEKQTSITEGVKNSIFSPVTAVFGIFQSKGALKDAYLKTDAYKASDLAKLINKNNEIINNAAAAMKDAEKLYQDAKKAGASAEKLSELEKAYKEARSEYKGLTSFTTKFKSLFNKELKESTKTGVNTLELLKGVKADKELVGAGINAEKNISSQFNTVLAENEAKYAEGVTKTATGKGFFSTIKRGAKSIVSKVASHLPECVKSLGKKISGSTFGKMMKGSGAGSFAFIEGGIELFTNVVPAFKQGGASSGFKQIGKSAAKVAGSCSGWALGATVGKTAGGFLGSFFGPLGTIIGGAVGGFLGGMIGSSVLSGIAEKITGKSEIEEIKDKQYEEAGAELAQDSASTQEVAQMVAAQVQSDIASGNVTEDTEKMAEYLQSGAFGNVSSNQTMQSYQAAYAPNVNQYGTNTNFTSNTLNQYSSLNDAAARIAAGDTSIYNVSNEKLNSLFSTPNSSSTMTGVANSPDILFKGNQKDVVNYYA